MNAFDYEAWRPALAAFYRKDGASQSAENVGFFGFELSSVDKRTIEALAAAYERLPRVMRKAA